ncbi:MAG: SusC/RagA family TonB-linked outer membrane protein [Chitinophagaceae bacterium]|nr:SusC/RagA family TonB-linked outer membrane protein [Chitinophagaceae bacterium]
MFLNLKIPFRVFDCNRLQFLIFLILLLPFGSFAQDETISGQVKDNTNKPLQGVSVLIKGTQRGTTTDNDGRFIIANVPKNGVFVISSAGYATQEIAANNKTAISSLTLQPQASDLNEVVVIGYGTRQKRDLTGSVGQVKATQLENENPSNVQDILRGNIAGINISQINSASAKGGGDLLVRGKSSIRAGTSPLIVLDDVIYPGQLSDINPNDIATINVLKDASSAAIYGAKSASGVVLITTKKGTRSKPTITLNSNIGISELAQNEPLYDGPGFVAWRSDVQKARNAAATNLYIYDDPRSLPSNITMTQWRAGRQGDSLDIWLDRLGLRPIEIKNWKDGKTTDWYDKMFQKGFRQDHTISLSGKKDEVSYYMSVGYTNNEGVIVGDKFRTLRTRLNLEGRVAKFLTAGINMQFSDRDESQVPVNWGQMVNASPYGEIYTDDGLLLRDSPNDDIGNNSNPFMDNTYTNRLQKNNTLFGSLYVKGNLPLGFSYQINFTPSFDFYRYFNGVSAKHVTFRPRKGVATRTTQTTYNWQIDNLLKWDKTFGQHQFNVTLLFNAEKYQSWREQIDNEGFDPSDVLSYHNIGAGTTPIVKSEDEVSTGTALMSRLNYTFRDRYMITASFRRDGYSAFGQKNPNADFPALALGWIFTEEKFMESATWLNSGKLRVSYGVNGNRDIPRYEALAELQSGKYQYISPSGALVPVSQLYVNRMENPDLKWERTTSYNLGLDFAILDSRLSGSFDVYKKSTKDLLILRALPSVIGFDNVLSNLGEVQNKGFEITLSSINITRKNFEWRTTINFWQNRNEIKHLYGPVNLLDANGKVIGQVENDDIANKWFIGHDLDEVWDQRVLGVWQESERAEALKYKVEPGDFKLEDSNNDGVLNDLDRQFLGFRTPRFQWTLRNEFTIYKNFDFSFQLYSNWGQMSDYNQAKNNSGFQDRQNSYQFPYWTKDNPINNYSRLYSSNGQSSFSVYRKTSFIRLNTVALAYTVPKNITQKAHIESLKMYVNVSNAALYAPDWDYWDPEYRNRAGDGAISTAIPPRIYSLGLNVTF